MAIMVNFTILRAPIVSLIGVLCNYGHSSLDRVSGYSLKYEDAFSHTHPGVNW